MTPDSKAFLDLHRHHYDLLIRAQYVKHLDGATREGLLQVARKEFDPGYIADLWCSDCVANMLRYIYGQYDQWLAKEATRNISPSA